MSKQFYSTLQKCSFGRFLLSLTIAFALSNSILLTGHAKSTLDDCEIGGMETPDDALLTKSEKIALMDRQFQDSLFEFVECMNRQPLMATDSQTGGSDGVSTSAMGIEGDSEPEYASDEQSESTQEFASVPMNQTEAGESQESMEYNQASLPESGANEPRDIAMNNGSIPEDIKQYDNDSVLEAQIKQAAMSEEDPELREKLWDQYRKYKQGN